MRVVSLIRLAVARHLWLRRALVVVPVVIVGGVTWLQLAHLTDGAKRWGTTVPVVVAAADLEPGDALTTASTRIEAWPQALAPPSALSDLDGPVTVVQAVSAGDALGERDVTPARGPAAFLEPGDNGVVIPVDTDLLAVLAVGDRVRVIVAGRSAGDGTVAHIGAATVVVALSGDAAPAAADAVLLGTATLVLRSPR